MSRGTEDTQEVGTGSLGALGGNELGKVRKWPGHAEGPLEMRGSIET